MLTCNPPGLEKSINIVIIKGATDEMHSKYKNRKLLNKMQETIEIWEEILKIFQEQHLRWLCSERIIEIIPRNISKYGDKICVLTMDECLRCVFSKIL